VARRDAQFAVNRGRICVRDCLQALALWMAKEEAMLEAVDALLARETLDEGMPRKCSVVACCFLLLFSYLQAPRIVGFVALSARIVSWGWPVKRVVGCRCWGSEYREGDGWVTFLG